MAYQPPLIGYKQLLNFSAYSLPDIGGWLFVSVGVILLFLTITEWLGVRKRKHLIKPVTSMAALLGIVLISSCNTGPEAIIPGKDQCDFCKMTVSDNRFGAEVITKKGKVYKFDDAHCVLSFVQKDGFDRSQVKEIYFTDFSSNHSLIKAANVSLLKSEQLKSPMAGNIAAFGNQDSLEKIRSIYEGDVIKWNDLYTP
jgi:copper chaperone NosL